MYALGQRKDIDFDNSRWVLASLYNLSIIHRGALGDHPCGLFLLGRSYIELILLVITTWTEGGFCINLSSYANPPPPSSTSPRISWHASPLHRRSYPPENGRRRLGHSHDPRGQEKGHLFSVKQSVTSFLPLNIENIDGGFWRPTDAGRYSWCIGRER